jgi:ketosteroid isomerase-like protein
VPQQNLEIIRGFLDAFNRGDYAACLETIDPDVEWHPPPDIPNAVVAAGRDALIANFRDWLGAWDYYCATPEEIIDGPGDTVLVFSVESGRGKHSGLEVHSRRVIGMYEIRDGKIVRFKGYLDRAEALEAAGLRE